MMDKLEINDQFVVLLFEDDEVANDKVYYMMW